MICGLARFKDLAFWRDALLGLERCAGGVISEMLALVDQQAAKDGLQAYGYAVAPHVLHTCMTTRSSSERRGVTGVTPHDLVPIFMMMTYSCVPGSRICDSAGSVGVFSSSRESTINLVELLSPRSCHPRGFSLSPFSLAHTQADSPGPRRNEGHHATLYLRVGSAQTPADPS